MEPVEVEHWLIEAAAAATRAVRVQQPTTRVATTADRVADSAGCEILLGAGLGVLSEESGEHEWGREIRVVFDPQDGSTNFERGLEPCGPSLWAFGNGGSIAAVVSDLDCASIFSAVRDSGAFLNGAPLTSHSESDGADLLIAGETRVSERVWGRNYGASAFELCLVATGSLDGFLAVRHEVEPWDYLGGAMIAVEAGCVASDYYGRNLWDPQPRSRCAPVVGRSRAVHDRLLRCT
jgi:myo-inositol-1(or 4)-monophosphatase